MRIQDLVDEKHPLKDVALMIRRAGMEHCFYFTSPKELEAMAEAGDWIAARDAAFLAAAMANPAGAMSQFDGGAALKLKARAETKAMAYAASERDRAAARD